MANWIHNQDKSELAIDLSVQLSHLDIMSLGLSFPEESDLHVDRDLVRFTSPTEFFITYQILHDRDPEFGYMVLDRKYFFSDQNKIELNEGVDHVIRYDIMKSRNGYTVDAGPVINEVVHELQDMIDEMHGVG